MRLSFPLDLRRHLGLALPALTLLLFGCGTHSPPLSEMPDGPHLASRREYLREHPGLPPAQFDAIYSGHLGEGLSEEQVRLLRGEPGEKTAIDGLFDQQWSWSSGRDTTWVFFSEGTSRAVDGTAPIYRFPEIERKHIVFRFVLPQTQSVIVSVYDNKHHFRGELLHATMESGEHELVLKLLEPKNQDLPLRPAKTVRNKRVELRWNAVDENGKELPNGLYYLRLESVDRNEMRRFTLLQ